MLRCARNVLLMVVGVCAVAASLATAQSGVFRAAPTFRLGGQPGELLPLIALADVGSEAGPPPDHKLDLLAVVTPSASGVRLVAGVGQGDGTFLTAPSTSLTFIPSAMVAADLTGDSIPDLLLGDGSTPSITFLRGSPLGPPFDIPFDAVILYKDPSVQPPAAKLPPGGLPSAIAVADFNGDTIPDAVVGFDGFPGEVALLLGDGSGHFTQSGPTVVTTGAISGIALGNFTDSGTTDVAVTSGVGRTVTILRRVQVLSPDNTLKYWTLSVAQTVQMPSSIQPVAIASADVNGDGRQDVLLANLTSNQPTLAVLLGLQGGGIGSPQYFSAGPDGGLPNGLSVGDVNGDHRLDAIVAVKSQSNASVLFGDGNGNFSIPRAFVGDADQLAIAAADINGDSVDDVVTVSQGSSAPTAATLLGSHNSGLLAVENVSTSSLPSTQNSVAIGDLNNDGLSDLIVADTTGKVRLLRAETSGGFLPLESVEDGILAVGGSPIAVAQDDVNRDGVLDIIVADASAASATVFLGRHTGGFSSGQPIALANAATAIAVGDWNVDGRVDFAVTELSHTSDGAVETFLGNGDGSFVAGPGTPIPVGVGAAGLDGGDFNKDGQPDLAVVNRANASILLGDGTGGFTAASPIDLHVGQDNGAGVAVADFDKDGVDDVAVGIKRAGRVSVFFGSGQGTFLLERDLALGDPFGSLAARDLTGDGTPDLLAFSEGIGNQALAFRSGGSTRQFAQVQTFAVGRGPESGASGDFDGDGRYDGVAACVFIDAASVMTNIVAPAILRGDGNGDAAVSAADLVALMSQMSGSRRIPVENVLRDGHYAPEFDANGDGLVTPQDAQAMAFRTFEAVL